MSAGEPINNVEYLVLCAARKRLTEAIRFLGECESSPEHDLAAQLMYCADMVMAERLEGLRKE